MSGRIHELRGEQRDAVDPRDSVWLSASAGTGKTQVLSARVLRLLLEPGAHPSGILCLTFTKAGAAEMAVRVNDVLARWVRLGDGELGRELAHIGAKSDPATRERARTLFASVLDCPGGGLRIDTIHAFSQWLLAAFPEEAGLAPGARAMEDRERELLARDVLAEMLVQADAAHDRTLPESLAALSCRLGEDAAQRWLMRCAEAHEAWIGPAAWQPPLKGRVLRLLGLPDDADDACLARLCSDESFDVAALRRCLETNRAWNTRTGLTNADAIGAWLADPSARAGGLAELASVFLTQKGLPRASASQEKIDPAYGADMAAIIACIEAANECKALLELAGWLAPALELGRQFAIAWHDAKEREGLIDFDDQIRLAAGLLNREGIARWIRYKLDRQFDHILIDEAQDTNSAQWDIIFALIDDFFSGEGAHENEIRTIFTVGDYKQAIFGFQGTSPENFEQARQRVRAMMAPAAANAARLRGAPDMRGLADLGLGRSFRTAQPVLDFVDAAIAAIGPQRFGLGDQRVEHVGHDLPGLVTIWPVVGGREEDDPDEGGDDREQEAGWLSRSDRKLADNIARQVRQWMDDGFPLVKGQEGGKPRRAGPGDTMVLVRKRKDLAGLIVARLHAHGVPVAGVDRLRLGAPLAVQDLMAALRFAAQPGDDLMLACLLVSPLIGWSQEDLLRHGYRGRSKRSLWDHITGSEEPEVLATVERLRALLARADFAAPQALLHWILAGPWQGRRKLVARLGSEINDPVDELLNAALAYSASHVASLAGFIRWFDAGESDLKREADSSSGRVRVMTVHGAKGLQAPIVILADAAGNPDSSPVRSLSLAEKAPESLAGQIHRPAIPLPPLKKEEKRGPIAAAELKALAAEREEHWRLLYVAMTRAEEALFIAGSLGKKEKEPAPDSWYARLAPLFGDVTVADDLWGECREWGALSPLPVPEAKGAEEAKADLPGWALTPVGPEPRPPRPLAPSAAGEDVAPSPPLAPGALREAARRGVVMHKLLERLPELPEAERAGAAEIWMARNAADLAQDRRRQIAADALAVLASPDWAEIFAPGALAEVPLMAVVDGQVIAGTADRVLVQRERVLVVDYKTTARPPAALDDVPGATLRQMAAYGAALGAIYPGRRIEAALLYTAAPRLIAIPAEVLAETRRGLGDAAGV